MKERGRGMKNLWQRFSTFLMLRYFNKAPQAVLTANHKIIYFIATSYYNVATVMSQNANI